MFPRVLKSRLDPGYLQEFSQLQIAAFPFNIMRLLSRVGLCEGYWNPRHRKINGHLNLGRQTDI
eukprot:180621-Prorocentrum_minimum.AAC.1